MKTRLICALCAVALCLSGAGQTRLEQAVETGDLVRLHVVADSDAPEDQAMKLEVRDAVLEAARTILEDCPDAQTAYARLTARLDDLETAAQKRARELGFDGDVTATMGTFDFPDRVYDDTLVPAGAYRALRVTLGSGQGANWWCVLYPTLCFSGEGPYRSVIVDWIQSWWGGNRE